MAVDIGFSGIGSSGSVALSVAPGPVRVRVDWGSVGTGGEPQVETYLPQPDGSFSLPAPGILREYADGSYTILAVAVVPGGPNVAERLGVFSDVSNTVGVSRNGTGIDDLFNGGQGNDTFNGGNGNDWVFGGLGADLLFGGNGNDFLGGGGDASADTMYGGAGDDLIIGDGGDDYLNGGTGNDGLYGSEGLDTLIGADGNDGMDGEAGEDSLNGGAGDDTLTGGGENDTLVGGDGDDDLFGNEGDDRMTAGTGSDAFYGAAGADMLVSQLDGAFDLFTYLDPTEGLDRIIGFEAGTDVILLNFIDGGLMDASRFVGSMGAMTDAGAYIIYNASNGRLSVDLNGTDAGGMQDIAVLVGAPGLGFTDIWFGSFT